MPSKKYSASKRASRILCACMTHLSKIFSTKKVKGNLCFVSKIIMIFYIYFSNFKSSNFTRLESNALLVNAVTIVTIVLLYTIVLFFDGLVKFFFVILMLKT